MRIFAVVFSLFVMVATAAGQDVWQSSQVSVRIGTDTTTKYAAPIAIAGSSNFRMVILANDVIRNGFGGDSIAFRSGYAIQSIVHESGDNKYFYRDSVFVIDSMIITSEIDSIDTTGVGAGGKADTTYTTSVCTADTTTIPGLAMMATPVFTPGIRQFLVPFVKPISGQREGASAGTVLFTVQRLTGAYSRK
jgi:hypothetical protein